MHIELYRGYQNTELIFHCLLIKSSNISDLFTLEHIFSSLMELFYYMQIEFRCAFCAVHSKDSAKWLMVDDECFYCFFRVIEKLENNLSDIVDCWIKFSIDTVRC